jgi:hypothetical protein
MEERFRDARLFRLYEYWQSKRTGPDAARRADIHLTELTDLLPSLHLIDVSWEPLRFLHRLIGTEIVEWMGRDVTGRYLDHSLYGAATDEIVASMETVAQEARPYHRTAHLTWHAHDWLEMEAVELPLLGDDDRVSAILCGAAFRRREPGTVERLIHVPLPERNGNRNGDNGAHHA